MPFDGNGVYNPISPPDFPAEPGTVIRAAQYNNEILDIASALTNCLTRDGQGGPINDIDWNNFRITGLAPGTAPADAIRKDQIDGFVDANLANGFTVDNNAPIKIKNSGGTAFDIIYVGPDNHVYFAFGSGAGNWFMRFNTSLNQVEFNKPAQVTGNFRVIGAVSASGNVTAFQP